MRLTKTSRSEMPVQEQSEPFIILAFSMPKHVTNFCGPISATLHQGNKATFIESVEAVASHSEPFQLA